MKKYTVTTSLRLVISDNSRLYGRYPGHLGLGTGTSEGIGL